jgi:hypothetical protein
MGHRGDPHTANNIVHPQEHHGCPGGEAETSLDSGGIDTTD